jgi:hypothetical protein
MGREILPLLEKVDAAFEFAASVGPLRRTRSINLCTSVR